MCQCHPVSHRNTEIVSQAFVAGDGAGRVWALTGHQQKTAYLVGGCARPLIPFTQCVCVCVRSLNAYFPYKTGCQSPMFAAAEVCQGQVQVFNWTAVGG